MKISDLLLDPHLDFLLDFLNIKQDGGGRVSSPPPCIIDMPCDMLLRSMI